jgi:hypothetical protein
MSENITYLIAGAIGALAVLLIVFVLLKLIKRRKDRHMHSESTSPTGARMLSRARYRGRQVTHYSDGSVLAETRFGLKNFESFDAYRYYVDRKRRWL